MLHVVIATGNRHKFEELKGLLNVPGVTWHSLADFPALKPARETGRTYAANAIKKARSIAQQTGFLALADDSGIEVDALEGKPGIRSARFAGAHGDDAANNAKLMRLLSGVAYAGRRARYRCALALCRARAVLAVSEGKWEGRIAFAPAGNSGFGYDPIFYLPGRRKTAGQITPALKQRISHRAAAARRLRATLRRLAQLSAKTTVTGVRQRASRSLLAGPRSAARGRGQGS